MGSPCSFSSFHDRIRRFLAELNAGRHLSGGVFQPDLEELFRFSAACRLLDATLELGKSETR